MKELHIIIAYDGTETTDCTPEAEIRIAAMNDLEERIEREHKRKKEQVRRLAKNPLRKLACACGLA